MSWREIKTTDVLGYFTPAEQLALNNILAGADTLSPKITDGVGVVRGFISAGANQLDPASTTTIPDQLRTQAIAFIAWEWLSSFPALKAFKTDDRKERADNAQKLFERIGSQEKTRPRVELPPGSTAEVITAPTTGHRKLRKFRHEDGIV